MSSRPEHLQAIRHEMEHLAEELETLAKRETGIKGRLSVLRTRYEDPEYNAELRRQIVHRFGRCPALERFSENSCRIWFGTDWHYREGSTAQQIAVYGFSETDCLEKLVAFIQRTKHIERGSGYSCNECRAHDLGD